jgi:arylsulfatase A-like enzyme
MKRFARRRAYGGLGAIAVVATSIAVATVRRSPTSAAAKPGASPPSAPPPAAAAAAVPTLPAPTPPPRRVVIISEDGLRPDAISPELTPRHFALMQEGARAKDAETIPESDTLPSHASMLSGVGAREHGLWWNSYQATRGFIHVPTIFSVAHEAGLSTAMIVGKPKLKHIASPGTVDHYERPSYLCGGVAKRAGQYFAASKPDLMFVHFADPDEYGHSHGWLSPQYMKAVRASDRCLATLLSAIDASGLAESTLVIVTADHGGHGKKHSDGHVAVDREIPWIVRGPGVGRGIVLDGTISTVDTAATTLAALGLPALPNMRGTARLAFTR